MPLLAFEELNATVNKAVDIIVNYETNIADDMDESTNVLLGVAQELHEQLPGYWRKGWLLTAPGQKRLYQIMVTRNLMMKYLQDELGDELGMPPWLDNAHHYDSLSRQDKTRMLWRDYYNSQMRTQIIGSALQSRGKH